MDLARLDARDLGGLAVVAASLFAPAYRTPEQAGVEVAGEVAKVLGGPPPKFTSVGNSAAQIMSSLSKNNWPWRAAPHAGVYSPADWQLRQGSAAGVGEGAAELETAGQEPSCKRRRSMGLHNLLQPPSAPPPPPPRWSDPGQQPCEPSVTSLMSTYRQAAIASHDSGVYFGFGPGGGARSIMPPQQLPLTTRAASPSSDEERSGGGDVDSWPGASMTATRVADGEKFYIDSFYTRYGVRRRRRTQNRSPPSKNEERKNNKTESSRRAKSVQASKVLPSAAASLSLIMKR